jgi:hypothetical protein
VSVLDGLKHLPSAASKALKNYFAGLGFFFNRQNWSHGLVFIVTIVFFAGFRLIQPVLQFLYRTSGVDLPFLIINVGLVVFFGGSGAFVAFLFLGILAIPARGRHFLYESRLRHLVSPIVVGFLVFSFSQIIPLLILRRNPVWAPIFGSNGLFQLVFNICWLIMVLLQVIVIGYSVVKSVKWLWGYARIPETDGRSKSSIAGIAVLFVLIPVVIVLSIPLIKLVMFGPVLPAVLGPFDISLPWFVRLLLSLDPVDYATYLLCLCPIVIVVASLLLWRHRPQAALAVAGFGSAYPVLVYYYRLRVVQYYLVWSSVSLGLAPQPFYGAAMFELALTLIAFLLALQGAAKLQRNVSPNPFGLFAVMIGALVGAMAWVLNPPAGTSPWLGIETFGMISAAVSAFLAVFVFAALPVAYGVHRQRHSPSPRPTPPQALANPSLGDESA